MGVWTGSSLNAAGLYAEPSATGDVGVGTDTPAASLHVYRPDTEVASISVAGSTQGSGMVFVGQSDTWGGGFAYDGDSSPDIVGGEDRITFFRRDSGTDIEVFSFSPHTNHVSFSGDIDVGLVDASSASITGAVQIQGNTTVLSHCRAQRTGSAARSTSAATRRSPTMCPSGTTSPSTETYSSPTT